MIENHETITNTNIDLAEAVFIKQISISKSSIIIRFLDRGVHQTTTKNGNFIETITHSRSKTVHFVSGLLQLLE